MYNQSMDNKANLLHPPTETRMKPVTPRSLEGLSQPELEKLREAHWGFYNNFFKILPNPKYPEGTARKKEVAQLEEMFPLISERPFKEMLEGTETTKKYSDKRLTTSDKDFFAEVDKTIEELAKKGEVSIEELEKLNQEGTTKSYIELNRAAEPIWEALIEQGYTIDDLAS